KVGSPPTRRNRDNQWPRDITLCGMKHSPRNPNTAWTRVVPHSGRGGAAAAAAPVCCAHRSPISAACPWWRFGMGAHGLNYLPLPLPFFALIVGVFLVLVLMLVLGVLRHAYMRLGINSLAASLILFASLIGSYVNIPVVQLPEQQVLSGQEIAFFGM